MAARRPVVLLTGFEPFAGATSNSSWDAVELVAETWEGDAELVIECLPTVFAEAGRAIRELVAHHSPDLVIATGLANGRATITPERVAINIEDARIPDNAEDQPSDRPIVQHAPAARWSGLPVKAIVAAISEAGIPSEVSNSAGTYVCNSVMYHLMDAVAGIPTRAGFIHVPASPALAAEGEPSLSIEDIARGLTIAIEVALSGSAQLRRAR